MALCTLAAVAPATAQQAPADTAETGGPPPIVQPCPPPPEGAAVVTGVVRDSASGVKLPGAEVSFGWERPGAGAAADTTVTTGRSGRYLVCEIPTGTPLTLLGTFPRRRAQAVLTLPAGREIVRLDFRLAKAGEGPADEAGSRIATVVTGRGGDASTLAGTIRDATTGTTVTGAQIVLPGLGRGTVSEPGGRFRIEGIPPGSHRLEVRHLGYEPAADTLPLEDPADLTAVVWLAPAAIEVEELEARVEAEREERGRARATSGYVIEREEFEKRPSASVVDLLRSEVPGLRTGLDGSGCPVVHTRSGEPLYVVDDVPFRDGCILREIPTTDIESIEVIPAVEASIEWGSLGGGGAVVIETREP